MPTRSRSRTFTLSHETYADLQSASMTTFDQFSLLLRVHTRMLFAKSSSAFRRSKLMTTTITGFLATYTIASYWLFSEGLGYVARLPAAGSLLSDRLVYVMFFCFLMMLMFSVAVTGYIALYRNRDTRWLLTLPVSHRAIFLWKCFESAMFSSWGLVFILAPLLVAFAGIREVGFDFYLKVGLCLIPFLILASSIGALLLVTVVRFLSRRQFLVFVIGTAVWLLISLILSALQDREMTQQAEQGVAMTFQRVLHHTNISVNRAIPSAWLSSAVIDWTRPYQHFGSLLYPTLLFSNCLMAILAVCLTGRKWFYDSWNRSLQQSAFTALQRNAEASTHGDQFPKPSPLRWLTGRPIAAISRKDFLTFFREPAQWVQFSLVFGLLAIYASGLRQMNGNIEQPRDLYVVAFLNLAVCALALSTLTTRFVFPQFSLEGRRLWILAMSPLRLQTLVLQKFVTCTLGSGLIVVVILLIGGYNLRLGFVDTLFFAGAISLLAIGLNAIAVGLGVLFPNLEEPNAAKIVSGFGGTLCLVSSFIFILVFVLLLSWLRWDIFKTNTVNANWLQQPQSIATLSLLLFLTLLVTVIPLFFSQKKLKRLEILSSL